MVMATEIIRNGKRRNLELYKIKKPQLKHCGFFL